MIYTTHIKIAKIVDGDSITIKDQFSDEETEIRLYGIDAPESKRCSKLMKDEKETHIAGAFLIQLGLKSTAFLRNIAPIGTACTIVQEPQNTIDVYGRTLAYLILPNGQSINEIMIREGYAKPYNNVFCEKLPKYQELNLLAKQQKKGLYRFTEVF